MRVDYTYRQQGLFLVMMALLASLFISRAALSVSMFALVALTCLHRDLPAQLRTLFRSRVLIGLSLLFFIPLVSGLWSENFSEWSRVLRIKLPLLFFPLAFAGSWQLSPLQWRRLAFFFIFLLAAGVCWSTVQYLQDPAAANAGFLQAKTFATPLGNDHVRFSWLVATGILVVAILWPGVSWNIRWVLGILAFVFILYLHLLAARTGLASFYMMLAAGIGYQALRRKGSKKFLVAGIIGFLLLPVACWFFLPTLQNRFKYIIYDLQHIENRSYLPGANDGNRVHSIRAGWAVMKQHPMGVGAGDLRDSVHHWYDVQMPGMLATDRLYPSSEWLVYGASAGWPGLVLFTVSMLLPFFARLPKHRFFFCVLQLTAAFSFLFDIGLEVQFGVFLYVFLILWWWKWFRAIKESNNASRPLRGDHL